MIHTLLYFECHVTTDPAFGLNRTELANIGRGWGFKLAELYMRKAPRGKIQPHTEDSFLTARGTDYEDLCKRTKGLIRQLRNGGFVVRRYKIEDTLLDSAHGGDKDSWRLL